MDVLTWVVVEQHQADVTVPNSSGLSAWNSSLTSVLPNDASELHQVIRWDGRLCLGHQSSYCFSKSWHSSTYATLQYWKHIRKIIVKVDNFLTFLLSKNPCLMIALPSMNRWKTLFLDCSSSITRRSALLYLVQHNGKRYTLTACISLTNTVLQYTTAYMDKWKYNNSKTTYSF